MRTRFTDLVGCKLPLQLAALGGVGTEELAQAVAAAGGLGMLPMGLGLPSHPAGTLGMGFLLPYLPTFEGIAERTRGARVVEFFWGEPVAAGVAAGHEAGALVSWQVGSASEAALAEQAGCDFVVIQGIEAGGHVRGAGPLDELLRNTLANVSIPVVAAGGIGTPKRVRELIDAGADAVRIGTRFLGAREAGVHPEYLAALIARTAGDTVLTDYFDDDGDWPATVRVVRTSLEGARSAGNRSTMPAASGSDRPGVMPWYAGLSIDHVHRVQSAAEIVAELTALLD
ncbi:NAD(P)H-dependent flavin oxidoreductase [Microbacterium sp. ASV49]|uniref:Nitronate monooxygenase n=1 Tax=Microbacterium candidum TaxID=3041922 RepID=A0ABT7N2P9_9MICO|nr:nitronate monooxygenase [Microbacterium sp. ASV49]MDL9980990.1 nitronate monooxygenase [Microbacterium sp. ASV49]